MEFSLIAFVLLFSIFYVIEVGLTYLTTLQLESATAQVARAIRTGQVSDQKGARQFVCDRMSLVASCQDEPPVLRVYAEPASTLVAAAGKTIPTEPFSKPVDFRHGDADQYVVVAVFLKSPLSVFRNNYQLRALTVVRNEPF